MQFKSYNASIRASRSRGLLACLSIRIASIAIGIVVGGGGTMVLPGRAQESSASTPQDTTGKPSLMAPPGTPRTSSFVPSAGREGDAQSVAIDPNLLLLRAIHQSVWGPPIGCKIYQKGIAYGQQFVAIGEYKASGNGRMKVRSSTRIAAGSTSVDCVQVSDGRLMYTQVGEDEPPRRVILDQVMQPLSYLIDQANNQPEVSIQMAIGGHAELLRGLYHRYRWYKLESGNLNGVEVWQLVGKLRTESPKILGHAPLDHANMQMVPDVVAKIPTEVRLTLGRSTSMAYFPYIIEYFHRAKDKEGNAIGLELVTLIEHAEPTVGIAAPDEDFVFRISDNADKVIDETPMYMLTSPVTLLQGFSFR